MTLSLLQAVGLLAAFMSFLVAGGAVEKYVQLCSQWYRDGLEERRRRVVPLYPFAGPVGAGTSGEVLERRPRFECGDTLEQVARRWDEVGKTFR